MPPTDAPRYSLTELADLAGVTPRTVRYYLSQGLLPSPGTSGPGAKYDDAHLGRLRLIRKLQREHLPLAEIRQRLAGLDDADDRHPWLSEPTAAPDPQDSALDYIRRVLGPRAGAGRRWLGLAASARQPPTRWPRNPRHPPQTRSPAATAPSSPHHARRSNRSPAAASNAPSGNASPLAPDIELHVRRPLPRPLAKQVDRLVSIARDLLEEDPS